MPSGHSSTARWLDGGGLHGFPAGQRSPALRGAGWSSKPCSMTRFNSASWSRFRRCSKPCSRQGSAALRGTDFHCDFQGFLAEQGSAALRGAVFKISFQNRVHRRCGDDLSSGWQRNVLDDGTVHWYNVLTGAERSHLDFATKEKYILALRGHCSLCRHLGSNFPHPLRCLDTLSGDLVPSSSRALGVRRRVSSGWADGVSDSPWLHRRDTWDSVRSQIADAARKNGQLEVSVLEVGKPVASQWASRWACRRSERDQLRPGVALNADTMLQGSFAGSPLTRKNGLWVEWS